jgi:electron transport complex protein RnfA
MIRLAILGICASLAMNLLTQFGLGLSLAGVRDGENPEENFKLSPQAFLGFFASLFLLWLFFTYILNLLNPGLYWYLLLYPLSTALTKGLDGLFGRIGSGRSWSSFGAGIPVSFFSFPRGWAEFLPFGLLISLHLALRPPEALVLALGFSLGLCLCLGIIREIRRRSQFEAVPPLLRGGPLTLISLGLLSLIFSSASILFFNLSRL